MIHIAVLMDLLNCYTVIKISTLFINRFPGEPGLGISSRFFSSTHSERISLRIKGKVFYRLHAQQCQTTEENIFRKTKTENSNHTPKYTIH